MSTTTSTKATDKSPESTRSVGDPLERLSDQLRTLAQDVDGPLRRVRLSSGDLVVEVEWEHATAAPITMINPLAMGYAPAPEGETRVPAAAPTSAEPGGAAAASAMPVVEDDGVDVVSPMVGTFYHAPSPNEPPFVEVGQRVEVGQSIGIVEAMKLLNPIESEFAGEVVAVVVGNGEPVEFSQPLVRIRPIPASEG